MANRKDIDTLKSIVNDLKIESQYQSGVNKSYTYENLYSFREAVYTLKSLGLFEDTVGQLLKTEIFNSTLLLRALSTDSDENAKISAFSKALYYKVLGAIQAAKDYELDDTSSSLIFKYSTISNFSDLEKFAKELKMSFDIPLQSIGPENNDPSILSIEEGSIVITVSFGVGLALVTKLIDLAFKYKAKWEEAKRNIEYSKSLAIDNSLKQTFTDAITDQVKTFLQVQAEVLTKEEIGETDNEKIEMVKNSITTLNGLLNRGLIIQPSNDSPAEIKEQFNEFKNLDSIAQKQIGE